MKITKTQLKRLIKEELNEVYSEKQRRWACAQMGDGFKGGRSLNKKEAEEMCKGPMKEGEVGPPIMGYTPEGDEEILEAIYNIAQDMGEMARAIKNPAIKEQIENLVFSLIEKSQEL